MKRLSLYLFLFFILFTPQTTSQADDIRDFEIEGMSVGDSLLDFFTKKEIKESINQDAYEGSDGKFSLTNFSGLGLTSFFNALYSFPLVICP